MSAEVLLGLCFAAATMLAALVEARRWSAEAVIRERVTSLEHRQETAEERLRWTQGRVDDLEKAARQDPHRKPE